MSNPRHESHVAQQIRRDKLRIQNSEDFPNNLEQLSLQQGLGSDNFVQVRNARNVNMLYEPPYYSSELVNFSSPVTAHKDLGYQDLGVAESSTLMVTHYASDHPASSGIHSLPREQGELRNLGNWRNSDLNQGSEWVVNYASSSAVNESNIPNSVFVPELNNGSDNQQFVKPSYDELTDVRCSQSNPSSQMASRENQGQIGDMQHSHSPSLYHNTLQDVVKAASISARGSDMASSLMQETGHGVWMGNNNSNELVLLFPRYANQSNPLRIGNANSWANRDEDSRPLMSDSYPQALSLSLSSNAQQSSLSVSQFESEDLQNAKPLKSIIKPSIISRDSGKSLQDIVGFPSNSSYRNVGPLGPFTGYATILKSSRFLKPAQQLLDEICCVSGPNLSASASASADAVNGPESGICSKGSSSSMFNGSKESSGGGVGSRPEYKQKKAKLLLMQEEVMRRYKQYHQQMQIVVSSFESVSVLSSATPYISWALRTVSRHFRGLKNAISDQVKQIKEVLGEDTVSAPSTTGTSSKLDTDIARLSYMDQSIQKNKSGGGNVAFLESQQHTWRPQRGLPERAVAILRAWLFEHFLHPYPTDTDKHMLATQTGLSRNQVSNWFINARVRVWKPMVEEIHMLETKGLTRPNQNSGKNEGASGTEGTSQPRLEQPQNNYGVHALPDKQLECFEMGSFNHTGNVEEQWNQEKRSKLECQISSSIDGTLMGFVPYQRGGVEVGGLGSVSLTLGLRHGVESSQHQQQQLQQESQLRRHFGGHMIHDFVG